MKNITIMIISHRRSGTHLTIDSIINNTKNSRFSQYVLEQISENHPASVSLTNFKKCISDKKNILVKTHMQSDLKARFKIDEQLKTFSKDEEDYIKQLMNNSKIVYVVRNPRDVMVSLYHYIKKIDKNYNSNFYQHLRKHLPFWVSHVKSWINKENTYLVRFEDFAVDYERTLKELISYLGLNKNKKIVNCFGIKKENRLLATLLQKLKIKQKSTSVCPRKGKVGDYKNYFGTKEKEYLKKIVRGILIQLGYEEDEN